MKDDSSLGKISIADEVITALVSKVVSQCDGIVGMAPKHVLEGLTGLLYTEGLPRGIEVDVQANSDVRVTLHVIMEYGVQIPEVARKVMHRVRKTLEGALGLNVLEVNVHVHGLKLST